MLCCQSTAVAPVASDSSVLNASLSNHDGKASDALSTRASDGDDEERIDSLEVSPRSPVHQPEPQLPADLLDDPFEPPPELSMLARLPPRSLCGTPSDAGSLDFCTSVFASSAASTCTSGHMTPIPTVAQGAVMQAPPIASGPMQAMVPMWFPLMQPIQHSLKSMTDVAVIPSGIVQGALRQFESIASQ